MDSMDHSNANALNINFFGCLGFRASLQPEPIYLRPNSAVLAARKATASDTGAEPKGVENFEISRDETCHIDDFKKHKVFGFS